MVLEPVKNGVSIAGLKKFSCSAWLIRAEGGGCRMVFGIAGSTGNMGINCGAVVSTEGDRGGLVKRFTQTGIIDS